jgi:hypothetical protein
VVQTKKEGRIRVHWKGAAEIVLEQCDKVIDENGFVLPMTLQKVNPRHLAPPTALTCYQIQLPISLDLILSGF